MDWISLSTSFPGDERVVDLLARKRSTAVVAFVCSLAFCGHQENGGFIPLGALPMIHTSKRDAEELVRVGLWEQLLTGYGIRNFDKYQVTNVTSADRTDMAKWKACRRWHPQPCDRGCPTRPEPDAE